MQLEIVTPEKKIYEGDAKYVKFPGKDGSFGVLNRHAAMISTLGPGQLKIESPSGETEVIEIKGGVMEMNNNKLIVLAEQ